MDFARIRAVAVAIALGGVCFDALTTWLSFRVGGARVAEANPLGPTWGILNGLVLLIFSVGFILLISWACIRAIPELQFNDYYVGIVAGIIISFGLQSYAAGIGNLDVLRILLTGVK